MKYYFLRNEKGWGVHYINGYLCWRKMTTLEAVENVTKFSTKKEAKLFAKEREVPYSSLGKVSIEVSDA